MEIDNMTCLKCRYRFPYFEVDELEVRQVEKICPNCKKSTMLLIMPSK